MEQQSAQVRVERLAERGGGEEHEQTMAGAWSPALFSTSTKRSLPLGTRTTFASLPGGMGMVGGWRVEGREVGRELEGGGEDLGC